MPPLPAPRAVPDGDAIDPTAPAILLVTEEDLSPEFLFDQGLRPTSVAVLSDVAGRSPLAVATRVQAFTEAAVADALARLGSPEAPRHGRADLAALLELTHRTGATQIVTPYAPTGPVASALADLERLAAPQGITLVRVLRDHDRHSWPHATHGFFRFREAVMG
jgi:deoxyribodipyrimidine photo-lyase